ncbi:hypothetical protein VFPPC_17669 [Pochonia chlamydosporia 170]|uniref:Uncharacterized protein n=1 Tax=Pochonia chlamydosporia 170 TaxID=1380566 RepID=A0A219ASG4_METCM|nr:hypothetical protein VFPPC_17669 [Pochonia chlamydosporia 170]OWT43155.1 hypothetical protein VFPPC_17669 [Pochonia chlamydosporia 170]
MSEVSNIAVVFWRGQRGQHGNVDTKANGVMRMRVLLQGFKSIEPRKRYRVSRCRNAFGHSLEFDGLETQPPIEITDASCTTQVSLDAATPSLVGEEAEHNYWHATISMPEIQPMVGQGGRANAVDSPRQRLSHTWIKCSRCIEGGTVCAALLTALVKPTLVKSSRHSDVCIVSGSPGIVNSLASETLNAEIREDETTNACPLMNSTGFISTTNSNMGQCLAKTGWLSEMFWSATPPAAK